jgi:uncharacterized membrane protein
MKLTNVLQNKAMKAMAAVTLAGAMLTAAVPAAQAQRVVVGVRFGGPRYIAPLPPVRVYGGPVFYGGPVYGYGYDHRDWRYHHEYYRRGWR